MNRNLEGLEVYKLKIERKEGQGIQEQIFDFYHFTTEKKALILLECIKIPF